MDEEEPQTGERVEKNVTTHKLIAFTGLTILAGLKTDPHGSFLLYMGPVPGQPQAEIPPQ